MEELLPWEKLLKNEDIKGETFFSLSDIKKIKGELKDGY